MNATFGAFVNDLPLKGHFVWLDSSITGYPGQIRFSLQSDSLIEKIIDVDSLGYFNASLEKGIYKVSPVLNYHWMGEELVRINEKTSTMIVEVADSFNTEIVVKLDTIPWPKPSQKIGLLKAGGTIDFRVVDEFMQERMEFFEIPGASLSLVKDGKIAYSQSYGIKSLASKQPVDAATLFEAGSITKLVFAFAVMRLYERGEIELDKPLHEYLPFTEIEGEEYKLMTARHVLCHQSGLSNWPRKGANGKYKLNFTPGTQFGYSGKAYEFLKLVLESISSKSIDTLMKEEVLEPLGIKDMYFMDHPEIVKRAAQGHKKYIPSEPFRAKRTMAAFTLQCTAEALAKFALALQKREGLKAETYQEMFRAYSQRSDGTQWGLGVRIEHTSSGISYGHSGSTGRGFISNLVFYDENGLGYVVLTNSQMGGWLSLPLLNEFLILGEEK
ncbi:MAG: beta-lactamase family protein [Bacteroidia bacterium]|nr:beta-lactamase family protein [Bacteroidia bacterium]